MSNTLFKKTALIITTYNQPENLELVLEMANRQKVAPHEIIVADDGSTEKTERVVREFAQKSTITIKHVWQEDLGYRLNHSRNNAVAVAESEYLSLIDGDCFFDKWFIHDHICFARQGSYIAGPRVNLNQESRLKIIQTRDVKTCLSDMGIGKKIHFARSLALAKLTSSYKSEQPKNSFSPSNWNIAVLGANLAFFRTDAVLVNGFNELWTYYGENDMEFCARLERKGIRRFKLRHYATVYHVKHNHSGIKSRDEMLTPTSPKYLESVDKTQTRCVDSIGLTRAISQMRPPVIVEGRYQKYLF